MYESYSCTGSSYHDFLSRSGSRGFYLDPVEDYGTDHFHSWESVPRSFARSLYVWCCRFILRAYQEFLIAFVFSLLISCPAFAEDENYQFQYIGYEAMANQGIDVNQYLIDEYQEERNSEIAQILAEPLASPSLRSAPVNDDFSIVSYSTYPRDNDLFGLRVNLDGDVSHISSARLYFMNYNNILGANHLDQFYFNFPFYSVDNLPIKTDYILFTLNDSSTIYTPFQLSLDGSIVNDVPVSISTNFLTAVSEVFTWILHHIAEIITFILGNAFLSVSLLLFMCGAVISFYVRIRRS